MENLPSKHDVRVKKDKKNATKISDRTSKRTVIICRKIVTTNNTLWENDVKIARSRKSFILN